VNTSHTYYDIGDYTPVLQVINHTWPGTATTGHQYDDYIGVYCPLVANFTVPLTGVVGQLLQFTDTSLCSPVTWHYNFDGAFSNLQNPTHAYSVPGDYHVWLNVTNKYGAQNFTPPRTISIGPGTNTSLLRFVPQDISMVTGTSSARKVQLILDRADFGLTSYTIGLYLDNTTTSNFYAVADRPWWIDPDKFAFTMQPPGQGQYLTISAWNTTGGIPAGSVNVTLGNITLVGSATGNNIMRLNSSSMAQYGSSFITLNNVPAAIHVYQVSPLPGYSSPPADLKPDNMHDGLLDDFDGNGVVNSNDVTVFFRAWAAGSLSSYPVAPFDYNHNGVIDTDDIVEFFNAYTHW
jgi:PKD repeat protein